MRRPAASNLILVLLLGVACSAPTPEHVSASSCGNRIKLIRTVSHHTEDDGLSGVVALDAGDVWAVGGYGHAEKSFGSDHSLFMHWGGRRWRQVRGPAVRVGGAPPRSRLGYFFAVDGSAPNDLWALAFDGNVPPTDTRDFRHVVVHWNGSSWHEVRVPRKAAILHDVAAVSRRDVWAVGNADGPLIEHWDGARWSVTPSQNDGTVLRAVAADKPSDGWAVGQSNRRHSIRTLVEHWDGSRWQEVPSPSPDASGTNILFDVSTLSPSDAWAVGVSYPKNGASTSSPLLEHWDGTAWSAVAGISSRGSLSAVTAAASDDVVALGEIDRSTRPYRVPIAERWDGASWRRMALPRLPRYATLDDASSDARGDIWIAGHAPGPSNHRRNDAKALILERPCR